MPLAEGLRIGTLWLADFARPHGAEFLAACDMQNSTMVA